MTRLGDRFHDPSWWLVQLRWPSGTCRWSEWRGGIHPALRAPTANDNGNPWWIK